jgi:hypothetical protein
MHFPQTIGNGILRAIGLESRVILIGFLADTILLSVLFLLLPLALNATVMPFPLARKKIR